MGLRARSVSTRRSFFEVGSLSPDTRVRFLVQRLSAVSFCFVFVVCDCLFVCFFFFFLLFDASSIDAQTIPIGVQSTAGASEHGRVAPRLHHRRPELVDSGTVLERHDVVAFITLVFHAVLVSSGKEFLAASSTNFRLRDCLFEKICRAT
jgi:hypothetical protein